jgi:large subunit ribosomal protein L32e
VTDTGAAPDERDLTDLDGVGPTTAEALREAGFESVADVHAATVGDLTTVGGIGPSKAQRIKTDVGDE